MDAGAFGFPAFRQSYMISPRTYAYNLGMGDFTIEAWIYTREGGPILGRKDTSGGVYHAGFFLTVTPSYIDLVTSSESEYAQLKTPITADHHITWRHVAAVRQGAKGCIYLDGVPQPTTMDGNSDSPMNVNSTARLTVGSVDPLGYANKFFNGLMAEVRLWDEARSAEDISSSMRSRLNPMTPNLIGYWSGELGVAQDLSPVRNQTAVFGSLSMHAVEPLRFMAESDSKVPFSGIYNTWTQTKGLALWTASQDLVVTRASSS